MVGKVTLFHAALISNTAKQLFINGKCNGKGGCKEHESAAGAAGSSYEEGLASVSLLSAPWGIGGCAAAAPRSMGGWGCPLHPPWPLGEGAQLFLYITCSPDLGVLCHLQKGGALATFGFGKAVPVGEKSPFEPHVGCFFILFPPLAGFIDGRRLWGWMCVHASRSRAVLVRAAFWPPAPRQHPSPWSISEMLMEWD